MATPAQISPNRPTGQNPIGPSTGPGNAVRHLILPGEDPRAYERLLAELIEHHRPQGPTERFLIAQMAHAQWKLERVARMEARLYEQPIAAGTAADPAGVFERDCAASQTLLKLSRYESATRRAWFQALKQLQALQAPRRQEDFRRAVQRENDRLIEALLEAPVPDSRRVARPPEMKNCGTKPISARPREASSRSAEPVSRLNDPRTLRL